MLSIQDRSELQQLKADLPPVQLFPSVEAAHSDMMMVVNEALQDARKLDCFPDEKLFVESMKELWLELYLRHAPAQSKAA